MNDKLRIMIVAAMIALGVMVTGCAPEANEQGSTLPETSTSSEDAETASIADEHAEEEGEHADEEGEHAEDEGEHADEHGHEEEAEMLALPELNAAELGGEPLRVVATTSIIGDVVAQVGGEAIALTVLMGPGQDPHSYEPSARDLTTVADSNVIFVNGWNLEEGLADDLENIGEDAPVVPISANIEPMAFGEDAHDHEEGEEHKEGEEHEEGEAHAEEEDHGDEHGHDHSGADPHVWFSIHNVEQWVENVANALSDLDPANAATYEANAAAYLAELETLEDYAAEQMGQISEDNRFLVTNHDAFGYFAHEYDISVLGTIIPGMSTLAEPSASDLADLITEMEEHAVCTIFTETTVSDTLAQTVAAELSDCDDVQVLTLYTGAVGPEGSGADSYIGMFRANVDTIVSGLQ
ncbi:MAG: zinc ABC transporter substrate-binding protein [Ardenticatenaceae bacterium]|nr:zinc ABC transporter substrate-binding protein [Ardenticatenaceae bacterium]